MNHIQSHTNCACKKTNAENITLGSELNVRKRYCSSDRNIKKQLYIGFKWPWKQALFQWASLPRSTMFQCPCVCVCSLRALMFESLLLPQNNHLHMLMFLHIPELYCVCVGRQFHVRGIPPTFLHLHCFYITTSMLCPHKQKHSIIIIHFLKPHPMLLPASNEKNKSFCAAVFSKWEVAVIST